MRVEHYGDNRGACRWQGGPTGHNTEAEVNLQDYNSPLNRLTVGAGKGFHIWFKVVRKTSAEWLC